jgi:hypothetical protein
VSAQRQYLRQLHLSGDLLVAGGYTERLYGISVQNGVVLWAFNAGNLINSHRVSIETAYLWSLTGWVNAIDTATGQACWRHRTTDHTDAAANWAAVMAELVVEDRRLYALAMDGVLHVLDTEAGEPSGRQNIAGTRPPRGLADPRLGAGLCDPAR